MSSCAFHSGMMTGNASISNNNFRVVNFAEGHSQTTHILGIGGLKNPAIVLAAKRDLLENYPLKTGQALANITVDFKRTFFFLGMTTSATVSADIIDFNPIDSNPKFDSINLHNKKIRCYEYCNFNTNDSIFFLHHGEYYPGLIYKIHANSMKVKYKGQDESYYITTEKSSNILSATPTKNHITFFGFEIGQKVFYMDTDGKEYIGEIFGINEHHAGIKYNIDSKGGYSWKLIPLGRIRAL
jgi:hypothetical protein